MWSDILDTRFQYCLPNWNMPCLLHGLQQYRHHHILNLSQNNTKKYCEPELVLSDRGSLTKIQSNSLKDHEVKLKEVLSGIDIQCSADDKMFNGRFNIVLLSSS